MLRWWKRLRRYFRKEHLIWKIENANGAGRNAQVFRRGDFVIAISPEKLAELQLQQEERREEKK